MTKNFLDDAYSLQGTDDTRQFYDDWADDYEVELAQAGYVTPARCAAALLPYVDDLHRPVLDVGCGTGLAGVALRQVGFTTIDGIDLSPDMLEKAQAKGIYRSLDTVAPDAALSLPAGEYEAVAAVGVIGVGAGPIAILDTIMQSLPTGGKCVFSFNDKTLQDHVHESRVMEWTDCGAARLLLRETGDHLPEKNVKATVYVLEKN